jgi:hypothetical protein
LENLELTPLAYKAFPEVNGVSSRTFRLKLYPIVMLFGLKVNVDRAGAVSEAKTMLDRFFTGGESPSMLLDPPQPLQSSR